MDTNDPNCQPRLQKNYQLSQATKEFSQIEHKKHRTISAQDDHAALMRPAKKHPGRYETSKQDESNRAVGEENIRGRKHLEWGAQGDHLVVVEEE